MEAVALVVVMVEVVACVSQASSSSFWVLPHSAAVA